MADHVTEKLVYFDEWCPAKEEPKQVCHYVITDDDGDRHNKP